MRIPSDEIRDWVIYKITSPSNRIYIGRTSNWDNRHANYKYHKVAKQVQKQRILYASLLKYGFDAHKIEKIDEFRSDTNYCSGKEIFWIRSYMSNYSRYPEMKGMNLTDGGEGNLGWKRPEESKEEIRKKNTGQKRTEEQRKRMSAAQKGRKGFKGRKMSEELKAKLVANLRKYDGSEEHRLGCIKGQLEYNKKLGRTIVQLDENGNIIREFGFLHEAAHFFGVSESSMRAYIKKKRVSKKISAILKYKKDL